MPGPEHSDWYPAALIVGTALATFLLGSATAMWLLATPLPAAVGPTALAQGGAGARGAQQMDVPTGSPAGPARAPTGQRTASNPAQSAETMAGSSPPPPAAAASSSPSAASPASAPASASPAAPQAGNFSLQFGAFLDQAKAKSAADQLAARGYAPVSVDAADGYGRTWHYVRLGAFADQRAAALVASDLLAQAGIGAAIVRVAAANAGG
jgi:cell division septation protein DedD